MSFAVIACAAFALGVFIGLIFGPDSEREHQSHVDGWLEGYRFASEQSAALRARHAEIEERVDG